MSKSFEMNGGVEGISERFVRRPMSSRTSDLYEFGAYRRTRSGGSSRARITSSP